MVPIYSKKISFQIGLEMAKQERPPGMKMNII